MIYLLKFFAASFFVLIFGASVSFVMARAVDGNEVIECTQWNREAKHYPGYYLTQWQDEQCKYHGIVIDAPIEQAGNGLLAEK